MLSINHFVLGSSPASPSPYKLVFEDLSWSSPVLGHEDSLNEGFLSTFHIESNTDEGFKVISKTGINKPINYINDTVMDDIEFVNELETI